jgi:hypothetical protein
MSLPQGISEVSLTVDYNVMIGFNQNIGSSIQIYPNPASSTVRIENAPNADVTIYNDLGNAVMTQKNIEENHLMNISGLSNGVYFIKLAKDNASTGRQLVVLKK